MTQDTRQQQEHRDFAFPDEVRAFGHWNNSRGAYARPHIA